MTDLKRDFITLKVDLSEDIAKKLEGVDQKAASNLNEIEKIINTIEA